MTSRSRFVCLTVTVLFTCLWSAQMQSTGRPRRGGDNYNANRFYEEDDVYHGGSQSPKSAGRHFGFDCGTMPYRPGMYADVHVGCQEYHVCHTSSTGKGSTFQCPAGTSFNQQHLICDWSHNVNCDDTHTHFASNKKLYAPPVSKYADLSHAGPGPDRQRFVDSHDFFTALYEARSNAAKAAEHASRAQHAAQRANEAAQAKHVTTQQRINDIRANADAVVNAARRHAQRASWEARSRSQVAQHAASKSVSVSLATADRAIEGATALRARANVKLVVAQAAATAISAANLARLQLAIQHAVRLRELSLRKNHHYN